MVKSFTGAPIKTFPCTVKKIILIHLWCLESFKIRCKKIGPQLEQVRTKVMSCVTRTKNCPTLRTGQNPV